MTRVRKTGRIAFLGAGPGDPGLLTRRALDFLAGAEHVVHDSDVDPALLALLPDGAERSPAEGTPGDVAKVLLSAARSGCAVVRISAGDPFASEDVVKEIQAVARTAVPFELVPGIPVDSGVPAYAGVPYSWQRTVADLRAGRVDDADWRALAAAPQPLVFTLPYADTGKVRAGLAGAGIAETMPVCVTVAGTTEDQRSASGTLAEVEQFADELDAADDTIVVLSIGRQVAARDKLSWWESRPLYGWRVLVPRTKQQ
ncbi:MAG: uroporphyrinogen-III C-methyltransferase, partial [Mycobacteriales bacterium]